MEHARGLEAVIITQTESGVTERWRSAGTQVRVSFDLSSAPDILERHRGGAVVRQDDYPAMVAAVERLGTGPELRGSLGLGGVAAARRLVDPATVAGECEALYAELAQSEGGGSAPG
jgi:hypothetical protein